MILPEKGRVTANQIRPDGKQLTIYLVSRLEGQGNTIVVDLLAKPCVVFYGQSLGWQNENGNEKNCKNRGAQRTTNVARFSIPPGKTKTEDGRPEDQGRCSVANGCRPRAAIKAVVTMNRAI